ncbi:response regulator [Sphingobacterium sp. lm-10]|uniref:response regulator n=1 Tax=Sphingobacterium sp. lm-10 TaxID=2944904 RepID=UPI00201FEE3D|nr:response regulator [Sphingobacterium sp. lm-10]MCL7986948.1 response regulator [Sphingobacterium sp. lm-10]
MIICVVDDDPIFHYVCKVNFSSLCDDLEFLTFLDGKQAYDYFICQSDRGNALPDIVLVDINMPVMNGWELVDHLNNRHLLDNTELYIVSSSVSPEDSFRSLSKKAVTGYVTKPLLKENFTHIYHDAIQKYNV